MPPCSMRYALSVTSQCLSGRMKSKSGHCANVAAMRKRTPITRNQRACGPRAPQMRCGSWACAWLSHRCGRPHRAGNFYGGVPAPDEEINPHGNVKHTSPYSSHDAIDLWSLCALEDWRDVWLGATSVTAPSPSFHPQIH